MSPHKRNDSDAQQADSILGLLVTVPVAALRAVVHRFSPTAVEAILTICGLILILSPLALWISWTKAIFYSVLGVAGVALFVAYAMVMLTRDDQR
ncbi:MAG: amino acid transporter [Gammaproteobacteria bacterium]|jgi:amino acid transporter